MNTDITKQMEMVLYRTEDDNVTVSALIKDETIWLTQKAMAELFGIDKSGISRHLAKIFETGELNEKVVVAKIATTTQHGAMQGKTQTNPTNYYNQADHTKVNMGLTTWKNAPDGRILKSKNVEKDIVNIDFSCRYIDGELKVSDESLEVCWVKREDALEMITFPLTRKWLENMLSEREKVNCFSFRKEPFEVIAEECFRVGNDCFR